jgi:hypothetical protein
MNRHFEDARYYLGRAARAAAAGVREELAPVERRAREVTGREREPEPSRLEKLQGELSELEAKAEGEAKRAITEARERVEAYRGRHASQ